MKKEKISLASDNLSNAHPAVIDALSEANKGSALPYGADIWTAQAVELLQQAFKASPKVLIIPNGTGANVLALKIACKRHESVICTDISHIHSQESGAAESLVGCKLLIVPHQNGKIVPEEILARLHTERAFGKHSTSPHVLSLTQPTEFGTVYTQEELKELSTLCKKENLLLHIDGSRLYNAAAFLNCSLSELAQAASPDLLSLGGTKNGLMCAESLLIFNPSLHEGADHLHKQTLGLISKMRYLSAQYVPFFKNDLWHSLAKHANQKAQEVSALIRATPHLFISYPVETNQIFFSAPASWVPLIQDKIHCYLWDRKKNILRFITSWNTPDEEIRRLKQILEELSHHPI